MPPPTGQHLGRVIKEMMEQARVNTAGLVAETHNAAHRQRLEDQARAASAALAPIVEALWAPLLDAGTLDDETHAIVARAAGRGDTRKPSS